MSATGRLLIGIGLALCLVGLALVLLPRVPGLNRLGRLPGDLVLRRGGVTIYVPIVTSLLLSLLLTLILRLVNRR